MVGFFLTILKNIVVKLATTGAFNFMMPTLLKFDKWCEDNNHTREEVWGIDSDWNMIDLPEQFENELLAYDELIATVERKVICQECLVEDDKLWKKYYYDPDDDEDWDDEDERDMG